MPDYNRMREKLAKTKPEKYKCLNCGLIVGKVKPWEKGECPNGVQHQFKKVIK